MLKKYSHALINYRWQVVVVTLFVVMLAAAGAQHLQMTTDYRVFFGADNPQLMAFDTLENTYSKNDNVLIVIAPKDGNVFTQKTLAAIQDLTKKSWQVPHSIRVDSLTNYQHTYAEGDEMIVGDLVENAIDLQASDLRAIRDIAINEPLLVRRLVAPTGDVAAINVTIHVKADELRKGVPEVVSYVRNMVDDARVKYPDLDFHVTGTVVMNNAFPEASIHDVRTLVPLMLLVVLGVLWYLLRDPMGVLGTLSIVIMSIAATMGLLGWAGMELTPPAASAPTIILTLAVADSVHLLASYYYYMRTGMDKQAAMVESLRVNFQPIFVTSLTTAVGLMALNFSDSPPFNQLGNVVAVGVSLAWLFSVTFLPALMMILPGRGRTAKAGTDFAMERFAEFVVRNRTRLFWINLAVIIMISGLSMRNEINDEFVKYLDKSTEFRRDTDFATSHLTGIYTIDYSLSSGQAEGIADPEFIARVEEFAQWLRGQPEVIHVNTYTDIMKRLNKNLHGDDPAFYRIPESRELAAQYLLLYEMSLPFGLDLNNQLNVEKSSTRLTATVQNLSSTRLIELENRAGEWLKKNAPASMHSIGASPALMFAHIGKRNFISMVQGFAAGLVLVFLTLAVAFRSLRYAVISLIPNVTPIMLGFGLWGVFVGEVGLGLSVVGSMTLGVVVDDTIHFMSKYLRARREKDASPEEALRYVFSSIGTAMIVLSVVLVAGFLVLALSAFRVNADLGIMTAMTFTIALAADFLFLGPLLLKLDKTAGAGKAESASYIQLEGASKNG
jgi:predicted RND superfamily exporter protein